MNFKCDLIFTNEPNLAGVMHDMSASCSINDWERIHPIFVTIQVRQILTNDAKVKADPPTIYIGSPNNWPEESRAKPQFSTISELTHSFMPYSSWDEKVNNCREKGKKMSEQSIRRNPSSIEQMARNIECLEKLSTISFDLYRDTIATFCDIATSIVISRNHFSIHCWPDGRKWGRFLERGKKIIVSVIFGWKNCGSQTGKRVVDHFYARSSFIKLFHSLAILIGQHPDDWIDNND